MLFFIYITQETSVKKKRQADTKMNILYIQNICHFIYLYPDIHTCIDIYVYIYLLKIKVNKYLKLQNL